MEGQHAMAEVADRRCMRVCVGSDGDRCQHVAAVPAGLETGLAQQLPAMRIGDRQRQAAIRVALVGGVHPRALMRGRADVQRVAVQNVGDELHVRAIGEERASDDSCAHVQRNDLSPRRAGPILTT
ncbi:hypothetical protein IXO599_10420 [Xanthomonas oryzae pv. oryzae]|nr:hypothetical protein IXO599_10420 [Xanthomonas oryzae pv. oryzae]